MSILAKVKEYISVLANALGSHVSLVISLTAFACGGLTLLLYAIGIHQLPEFTWNDLTGTVLAVFFTSCLVVPFVVAYCLLPGYVARRPLEAIYLDTAGEHDPHTPVALKHHRKISRFIAGVSVFNVLFWMLINVQYANSRLISPYDAQFFVTLIVAILSLLVLLLWDWARYTRQWFRYLLIVVFSGSLAAFIALTLAWQMGPDSLTVDLPTKTKSVSTHFNWSVVLHYAYAIGIGASFFAFLAIKRKEIKSFISELLPEKKDASAADAGKVGKIVKLIFGGDTDQRLMLAKVWAILLFLGFGLTLSFLALGFASAGDSNSFRWNFAVLVAGLSILNWVSFTLSEWRQRFVLCLFTAVLVFGLFPLMLNNPLIFPRMIVSILGLGNERLASVSLSSKQCAALLPFGVDCVADEKGALTLTDLNLLSRVGATNTFELLVKVNAKSSAPRAPDSVKKGESSEQVPKLEGKQSRLLKIAEDTSQKVAGLRSCDEILLSQIEAQDPIRPDQLRCVSFVVPKDQVFGYTKYGARNYRGNYSAHLPGPDEEPKVIKLIGENASEKSNRAAVSSAILE